ncbi:MAG: peroxiredoxin [Nitrospinales bacterium]
MLSIGTEAPDFSVKDHNGNTVSLKDFRGRKVVLWFYPRADTPGCTMEGQGFRDEYRAFEEKKIAVLGISLDSEADNKAFAEKFSLPYPLLCDVDRRVALTYGAVKSPEDEYASRITYVIDEDGTIAEVIPKVNTETHASELGSRL